MVHVDDCAVALNCTSLDKKQRLRRKKEASSSALSCADTADSDPGPGPGPEAGSVATGTVPPPPLPPPRPVSIFDDLEVDSTYTPSTLPRARARDTGRGTAPGAAGKLLPLGSDSAQNYFGA